MNNLRLPEADSHTAGISRVREHANTGAQHMKRRLQERKPAFLAKRETRLLPMLHLLDLLPPATVVLGRTAQAAPVLLSLGAERSGHLMVAGPGSSGKSELLRSALLSLCLTSRPAQLCVLGIDLSGRELAVLESVPHALSDLATEPVFAAALIRWMVDEQHRRAEYGISRPHLALMIDDLEWLAHSRWNREARMLNHIMIKGASHGMHILAAAVDPLPVVFREAVNQSHVVRAATFPGQPTAIVIEQEGERVVAEPVWSSAHDLNIAAGLASAGWLASHRFLDSVAR